jgi:transcriptional antiterminator NusG
MANETTNPDTPTTSEPEKQEQVPAAEPSPAPSAPSAAEPPSNGSVKSPEAKPAEDLPEEDLPPEEKPAEDKKHWFVVKVQSGREESIKDAIERRVKIEGLQEFFGEIFIPVEKYTDMVRGKRVVKERKLYPGYLMVNVEYNDRILYLFRETSGVGDFVGAGLNKAPQPMKEREVQSMLIRRGDDIATDVPSKSKFDKGDRVKVKDGTFAGMEGEVKEILEAKGALRVELTIFGRPVPVELEYWQVDNV